MALWRVDISRERVLFFNGFSGGLLIGISLVHLLPESGLHRNYPFAIAGFGIFYLIEAITKSETCTDVECPEEHTSEGMLTWAGMSFHALVDGVAMGVGFSASAELGLLIALAILLHKAPLGFSLTGILLSKDYSRRATYLLLLIFSTFTPVGAVMSGYIISVNTGVLQAALAFSGGTFLHISVSELLPQVHNQKSRKVILYVLLGMSFALLPRAFGIH